MSVFDVEPEDMTRASVLDKKLDALLGGQSPAAGDELAAELSLMLEQVQEAFPPAVMPEHAEDAHFARMMEAAAGVSAEITAPVAVAQTSAVVGTPLPVLGRIFDKVRMSLSRRVAAATLALTTAFGGAAYAGILPTPIQSRVANAAAAIGLQLPGLDDEASVVVDEHEREDDPLEELIDTGPDHELRGGDAAGDPGADDGDAGHRGSAAGSDDDEGRDQRDGDRDGDRDDDAADDEDDDAEADDATDDQDGDAEDRSHISDDREDVNDSDSDDAAGTDTDDDPHETDEPEGSSDDAAVSEESSDPQSDSEAGELDD